MGDGRPKPGPQGERLVIDVDPQEALSKLLGKGAPAGSAGSEAFVSGHRGTLHLVRQDGTGLFDYEQSPGKWIRDEVRWDGEKWVFKPGLGGGYLPAPKRRHRRR